MILRSNFESALATLPRPGGNGYHPRLLGVANIGIRAGVPPEEVAAALRANTPPGGRRVPDREITDAVAKATQGLANAPRRGGPPRWRVPAPPQQVPQPIVRPFDAAKFWPTVWPRVTVTAKPTSGRPHQYEWRRLRGRKMRPGC